MARHYLFTSESVTEGHPDKVCDQISDAVLDAILEQDPNGRVACETTACTGLIHVMGEITTSCYVDIAHIAREVVRDIGYDRGKYGFDCDTCAVVTSIDEQSADIAMGVDKSLENKEGTDSELSNGAGDQGMMFGFACNETPTLMPAPIFWAHQLSQQLTKVRKDGTVPFFRPDGKTQVSFEYLDGKPVRINNVVVSTQHAASASQADIIEAVKKHVIRPVLEPSGYFDEKDCEIFINTTGRFVVGGPMGDCGLTGRKIIQDTYGGSGHHGGGAFSGKDPTKVDRSAAYMARYVAKNLVAAGLAAKCQIELAYAIGVAHPVSVLVDTFGTGRLSDARLSELVSECFDLRPAAIIRSLDLRRPIYQQVAAYGHFGRADLDLPWEKTDAVERILARA